MHHSLLLIGYNVLKQAADKQNVSCIVLYSVAGFNSCVKGY